MSRHTADHRELDDASQWDSAQALDDSDNLLALEEQAAHCAALAVAGWAATLLTALICALGWL